MNKQELIDNASEKAECSKASMKEALDALVETMTETLASGDDVVIPGFGKFEVRERPARTGRNPQTGKPMKIKAKKVAAFKPYTALAEEVNTKKKKKK